MRKKLLLIVGMALFLFACTEAKGANINIDEPMETAEFLNEELGLKESISEATVVYPEGFRDVYRIGNDTEVVFNDEGTIIHLHFSNRSEEEILEILSLIGVPTDSSDIKRVLSLTPDTANATNFTGNAEYGHTQLTIAQNYFSEMEVAKSEKAPFYLKVSFDK